MSTNQPNQLLQSRPLICYLAGMAEAPSGEEFLSMLYDSHTAVSSIFRMLPPLAQKCLLHAVYHQQSALWSSVKPRFEPSLHQALDLLQRLRIVEADSGNDSEVRVNEVFRLNHVNSLLSSPMQLSGFSRVDVEEKTRKSVKKDLAKKPVEKWESILSYLALPTDKEVSRVTKNLFQHIGFTVEGGKGISPKGFQFLLLGRVEQMWTYLTHYLKFIQDSEGNEPVVHVVRFLMGMMLCVPQSMLESGAQLGHLAFSVEPRWGGSVVEFIQHLRKIGLLHLRKKEDNVFFITPLLIELAASGGSSQALLQHKSIPSSHGVVSAARGFIITETNFRVYAYTDSRLHLAILSSFTDFSFRLPGVVVAAITRDSVREALKMGITSQQIVLYLKSNAHPQVLLNHSQTRSVPPNVVEQIELWDQERRRLAYSPCSIYSNFDTDEEYAALKDYATQNGFLIWFNDAQQLLAISDEGEDQVREWWRQTFRN